MDIRGCDFCGASLVLVRVDARFCSTKCRVYSARAARKAHLFPSELTSLDRFVRFMPDKRPVTISGKPASSTDSATWSSYKVSASSTSGEGIGFVLGAGIGCIDLDHCFIDGVLASWASDVVEANPATFIEVSRSGEGLHLFGLLAEGPGRKIRDGRNVEVYSVGRYIALTGNRHGFAPLTLAELVVPVS
jgi:primase-polymerase (primpol)-like protein